MTFSGEVREKSTVLVPESVPCRAIRSGSFYCILMRGKTGLDALFAD